MLKIYEADPESRVDYHGRMVERNRELKLRPVHRISDLRESWKDWVGPDLREFRWHFVEPILIFYKAFLYQFSHMEYQIWLTRNLINYWSFSYDEQNSA